MIRLSSIKWRRFNYRIPWRRRRIARRWNWIRVICWLWLRIPMIRLRERRLLPWRKMLWLLREIRLLSRCKVLWLLGSILWMISSWGLLHWIVIRRTIMAVIWLILNMIAHTLSLFLRLLYMTWYILCFFNLYFSFNFDTFYLWSRMRYTLSSFEDLRLYTLFYKFANYLS